MLDRLSASLPPSHAELLPQREYDYDTAMVAYKHLFQTDKNPELNEMSQEWRDMNDGWDYEFFDDSAMQTWVNDIFPEGDIRWAWEYMPRPILKADFLRYLLPFVKGGVYSDVDVSLVKCR